MADIGLIKRMLNRLKWEFADVRLLRTSFFKPRLSELIGRNEFTASLAGVGPVNLRSKSTDLASFRRVFAGGEYRLPEAAAEAVRARYKAILEAGRAPVIVDAGAYVGASALWFARCFPEAHVVALEPDQESFRLLQSNLGGNQRMTAIPAAVGGTTGYVQLVAQPEQWATQVQKSADGIAAITMNEAFAAVPNGESFIAKINIEGFESDVFSGDLEWLDRIALLFIEPHDWLRPGEHTSRSFQRALGERDFGLFIVGPHLCYARLGSAGDCPR